MNRRPLAVDQATLLFDTYRARLRAVLPEATVFLSGSASVATLSANDVDLVVLVEEVNSAAAVLRLHFPTLFEDEWREDWAAFRISGPPQVDIVVTREGTRGDAYHRRAWELIAARQDLLDEYRSLKERADDYERRKAAFFDRVVGLLGT